MKKWYGTMIVLLGNKLMKASENYGSHYNAVWIQSLAEISSPLLPEKEISKYQQQQKLNKTQKLKKKKTH